MSTTLKPLLSFTNKYLNWTADAFAPSKGIFDKSLGLIGLSKSTTMIPLLVLIYAVVPASVIWLEPDKMLSGFLIISNTSQFHWV